MPVNFLLYNSLLRMGSYYGDSFKVECPTSSGRMMNLAQVAHDASKPRRTETSKAKDSGRAFQDMSRNFRGGGVLERSGNQRLESSQR